MTLARNTIWMLEALADAGFEAGRREQLWTLTVPRKPDRPAIPTGHHGLISVLDADVDRPTDDYDGIIRVWMFTPTPKIGFHRRDRVAAPHSPCRDDDRDRRRTAARAWG